LPGVPSGVMLTISIVPLRRSQTKTSALPLVSSGTRFFASDANATTWPSALMAALELPPSGSMAPHKRSVVPAVRSRTKMSVAPF